ncbi:hypothetical protein T06_7979 [Trichinella sp. T6]|nr:hypothetical protein T06_7979 [Trichinella sp. T6]
MINRIRRFHYATHLLVDIDLKCFWSSFRSGFVCRREFHFCPTPYCPVPISYRLLGHGPVIFEPLLTVNGSIEMLISNSVLFDVIEKEYIRCIQFVIGRGLAESCQNEDLDDCDNKASFIAVEAAIILFENALQLDLDNNQIWKCIAHSGDILKKVGSLPVFRQTMYQI